MTAAENDKSKSFLVNGMAVGNLAKLCKRNNIKFIHFSTDYVFKGDSETKYIEPDDTNPINIYGASKLEGEKKIVQFLNNNFLIIRISWLFGEGGNNFVSTISKLIQNRDNLKIVNDQFGKVTYTQDVVNATQRLIALRKNGIFHFANKGILSRYEFTKEIYRLMKTIDNSIQCRVEPIPASEYPDKTPRPSHSCLDCSKFEIVTKTKIRNWEAAISDMIRI